MNDISRNHPHPAPPRHHLVWLDAATWLPYLLHDLAPNQREAVQDWFLHGYPAVARRRLPDENSEGIPLGIPLPPGRGRLRIALRVDQRAVLTIQAPPRLQDVIGSAPRDWHAPLTRLAAETDTLGVTLQVYGSVLWQHLTGQSYVTPHSDIDLLFHANDARQLHALLTLLQTWQRETGRRADGELLLPGGRAVAWRELLGTSHELMVKTTTAIALVPRNDVLPPLTNGHP